MKLKFIKMNGAGNDFVIIDDEFFKPESKIIKKICDRHRGVGADGVLVIGKSNKADFCVRYFNADGSGDTLCVNGARCAALFGFEKGLHKKNCKFEFIGKIFSADILKKNLVRIYLDYSPFIDLKKEILFNSKRIIVSFFDLGSKHIVIEWNNFQQTFPEIENNFNDFDINKIGSELRNNKAFAPHGVNVNFIKKIKDGLFAIRTYERGVERETLACGSGSIASSLFINLNYKTQPPIRLRTKSGKILITNFQRKDRTFRNIYLEGPAEKVFEGIIKL